MTLAAASPPAPAALARSARRRRAGAVVVLAATFVCAACGLVYELALITLGSYLIGNTVHQASIVLGVMVFAMGVGALAAKRLQRRPAAAFAAIEIALALCGGLSVMALYAAFAWLDLYQPALVATAFLLGALIGAEIPVLMVLLQRMKEQAAGDAVADLFAADYVGALVGGLAFPFVLLPRFGQLEGALLVGAVNLTAAAVVTGVFRRELGAVARAALATATVVAAAVLGLAAFASARVEVSARQALYDEPVVFAERTPYQEIVVTQSLGLSAPVDTRLFLDGDLQFSSLDEHRYHEALVHPAMAGGPRGRVAVLGGGDGLALREVLRYRDVHDVVLVELDRRVVELSRDDRRIAALNQDSLRDPRVRVVHADAFTWLREQRDRFDVVVADFPDPESAATAKLYSVEFYGMVASGALAPGGRLVVQAGSPYFAPDAFWCIEATVAAAGLRTAPYQAEVPSFGPWGFVLAAAGESPPPLHVDAAAVAGELRYATDEVVRAGAAFPPDRARRPVGISTLLEPRVLEYERAGWRTY